MVKKKVLLVICCIAILLLAAIAIDAASTYRKPSKYQGLKLGVKIDPKAKKSPCVAFGCGPWHTAVVDKDAKKAYRCSCQVPSTLKKDKAVCFMSTGAAKKVGYKEEKCQMPSIKSRNQGSKR